MAATLKTIGIASALAALASAVGVACGVSVSRPLSEPPLPPAGSPQDDGSGFLAWVSGNALAFGFPGTPGGITYARPRDYRHENGEPALASSAGTGGTLYGNYRFEPGGPPFESWRADASAHRFARDYDAIELDSHGLIAGRVLWPNAPRTAPLATSAEGCGGSVANDTLRMSADGGVAGAVVYLEDIRYGRAGARLVGYSDSPKIGGILRQSRCRFWPHVQILMPLGATLTLHNDSAGEAVPARTWTGTMDGKSVFSAPMAALAQHRVILGSGGFVEVRDGASPASAWVAVAGHPYYAMTDERGYFELAEVPPGTYSLVVWHEPVAVPSARSTGRPDAQAATRPDAAAAPIQQKRRVTVNAAQTTELTITLAP